MKGEYYLGLDMGSSSVGWAVTNEKYEILRAHGKTLWGVRLFDSAQTAEERRGFRTAKRRLDRRNWRIELLQKIFAEEVEKIDDGFFRRMKESRYWPEDKRDRQGKCPELPYALFADDDYTDKEYHKQFPTIYHLRKWLMETDETPDIRLIYLALHHMMKHRGHFLLNGNIEQVREFQTTFEQFLEAVRAEELGFSSEIGVERSKEIEAILKDRTLTKSAKKTKAVKAMRAETSCEKEWLGLITGGTAKLGNLFGEKQMDTLERPKLCFADAGYEEYAGEIEAELGEKYVLIEHAKAVYDWAVLADILQNYSSLSEAKVALYEKHKKDLKNLKKLVRENLSREEYQRLFAKKDEKANYYAYIKAPKQCSQEDFYGYLKKNILGKISDVTKASCMQKEMEMGTFLPKQTVKDNSVIPYQIHLYELNAILKNLEDKVPLLKENGEKIQKIFTFRIPYYVGPLNGIRKKGEKSNWAVRKEGKIYPWNFDEMVDLEASAEQFIRRMTNKCTYLPSEDVLPKYSLLYSKYEVLNELNNLRLDGEKISVEQKQKIYEEVFQKSRKVTQKKLKNYLVKEGITGKEVEITGIDGDFKSSLTAYHDFKEKLTNLSLNQAEKECIILNVTLFGDDKAILKQRLKKLFPELTEKQRDSISKLPYRGWGRLSKVFLEETEAPAPETGEAWSIIRALWETNDNLMQLLSEKYLFASAIEEKNGNEQKKRDISYELVEELYVSPAVKRQIWQSLLIVKEICKVMGNPPKRVFIEMAREKNDQGRTSSRKKKLLELYKKCKVEEKDWIDEIEKRSDAEMRRDKLYLYYTQKGKCMYSGETIELEELWDNQKYDIDHIFPQSKVMDDSLDNRVLVKKKCNQMKEDKYPIDETVRKKMQPFWKSLVDAGLISEEKYKRLIRGNGFEPSELAGFISRQLVETRQSTKAAASILQQVIPDTQIVYVKAPTVSKFRKDFKFLKVREMNDYHHAKDAYLNIVVGNAYFVKFTSNPIHFIKENPGRSYNLKKMFEQERIERNGEIAWESGNGTIATVRKFMEKNNILVTRRSYEATGALFDQQIVKKGKGQVPIKSSDERLCDIQKYGGYNKEAGACFVLAESEGKKGKKIRTIEYVPIRLKKEIQKSEENIIRYLEEERQLKNPRVLVPEIKIDTLLCVDGFYMWVSGRSGDQLLMQGANQLVLSQEETEILKKIVQYVERKKQNKELKIYDSDHLEEKKVVMLYETFLNKLTNTVYAKKLGAQAKTLTEKREKFKELCIEEKCIVLYEILHFFQCQSVTADLKLIGGSGRAGILYLNKNITDCSRIEMIHQSPTGIYEQAVDLNAL